MQTTVRRTMVVLLFVVVQAALTASDDSLSVRSNGGAYLLVFDPPFRVAKLQDALAISFTIDRSDGKPFDGRRAVVTVDAQMPGHYHGLTRQPRVELVGHNRYTLKGLFFHMPGAWDVFVDVKVGRILERTQLAILVK